MLVFKFGGASVKDAEGVKNVWSIVEQYKDKALLIVVSAMGKTTNALEEVCAAYYTKTKDPYKLLEEVRKYHYNIIDQLESADVRKLKDEISNALVEIEWILEEEPQDNYDFVYDQLVSVGEILSTKIIASYLQTMGMSVRWIDARSYIQTDNSYREGQVDWEHTEGLMRHDLPEILKSEIIVTQGFVGGTSENYTTTLGREGSDYSAAIFASCLQAESLSIWKDVPGVLNADPKLFSDTEKYDELSYSEALEMSYYGASVIHPKTIKPLQNKGIPLHVRPFLHPNEQGTSIGNKENIHFKKPAIIVKKNQLLMTLSTKDYSFIAESNLSSIFRCFADQRVKINCMQNSAMTFSCCIDYDPEKIQTLIEALQNDYRILYNTSVELITVRHYEEKVIQNLQQGKELLLEQRSRNTVQLVLR